MRTWFLPLFVFLLLGGLAESALAQTGRISGRVTDRATGEPLPGVNIVIEGTTTGTASDMNGFYSIIGARPGTVTVRATYIGFSTARIENVRVNIDQNTPLDIQLSEESIVGADVVITAERPVLEADVSSSRVNVSSEQINALPVASVATVVGLQAGAEGLNIRGSAASELSFNVNGMNLRDERTNAPYTAIPLASVQEVQVVTSGFNAEYGNVRSGVVNVITKEGSANRFEVDLSIRYNPPSPKNFGGLPNDPDSYWMRPFTDPAVAFTGTTNGAWDVWTQRQYPEFKGWVAVSEQRLANNDPTKPETYADDMTPEALLQAFLWQHRKRFEINRPDYNMDLGFGGPVPLASNFGNTRFYASFKRDQDMYFIPLATDRFTQNTGHLKLTTEPGPRMKLNVEALYGQVDATSASRIGQPGVFRSAAGIAGEINRVSFMDTRVFSTDYWNPTRTRDFMVGARFTHALDANSFYEIRAQRYATFYDTNPGRLRDTTCVQRFGGVCFDEGPFGFQPRPSDGVDGMRMGVGMSNARDTSRVVAWNVKADFTRQMNRFIGIKTGAELNITESKINFGSFDAFLPSSNFVTAWDRVPVRGALYAQGTLEFQGLIANPGLRLEYAHAGGEWYDYDVFSPLLGNVARLDTSAKAPTKRIVTLSPRLGVSFPVTEFSKLWFNYGHFRSMPSPDDLYQVRVASASNAVTVMANPNNPLPKTVAYEIGYEHALFDQYRVRLAGYYKNTSLEPRSVTYTARNSLSFSRSEANNYSDTRGFELEFRRERGNWVRGFVNYTYMVRTAGYFGLPQYAQNPTRQREIEVSDAIRRNQTRPVPSPYARLNLDFFSPARFGPKIANFYPLANWRVSFLGSWREGSYMTWLDGGGSRDDVLNNIQFKDFTNMDLRVQRTFNLGARGRDVQFFMDVSNLFNQRRLTFSGFADSPDYLAYMTSLHLPSAEKDEYTNIPGNDRVGAFRKPGVPYQPMFSMANRATQQPLPGVIYYERATQTFLEFVNGNWTQVDQSRIDRILDDKAYIDMPNLTYQTFLNPRAFYFGLRISF